MSLSTRKRALIAKTETTYGVDATPVGADAMLVRNLNVTPLVGETIFRDLIRPFYGNSESILTQSSVSLDFEIEFVGTGIVGNRPGYDALLQACGFDPQPLDLDTLASLTCVGTVATATLTAHGFAVGDRVVISGALPSGYNGVQTIVTVPTADTFTFTLGSTLSSPATGTPQVQRSASYLPISEGFQSCTIYYYNDSVLHKAVGCFGTVELSVSVKQIPVFKFTMTGLYSDPVDATLSGGPDFSNFAIPQVANTQNTPGFTLYGYSAALSEMTLQLQNQVEYVSLIGKEDVKLLDRRPQGTLVFEAPNIADKDFFTIVQNSETGVMQMRHGSKNGFKVQLDAPKVLIGNPAYQDLNGTQMLSCPFTLNPGASGNDELVITFS